MSDIERLAVMFSGCMSYHPAEALGSGYRTALNRVEVAAMMAGLQSYQRDYVYAYHGDEGGELRLLAHVRFWMCDIAQRESWKLLPGQPIVCNLAAVAVFESVRPNVCDLCHGSGRRGLLDHRVCHPCSGTGRVRLSGRRIAEAVGLHQSNFVRTWSDRYERTYRYVRGIEDEVNCVIRRAASRDYELMA